MSRLMMLYHSLSPRWMQDRTPDETHFYRRCFTRRYREKKRIVRDVWLGSACAMLLNPVLPFILALGLATTFLAFVILDETA